MSTWVFYSSPDTAKRGRSVPGNRALPHSTKQCTIALLLQGLDSLVRQSSTGPLEGIEAGIQIDEGELESQRRGQSFEDAFASGNDFTANAISGDEACGDLDMLVRRAMMG